ncbi:hypothetical protein BsWGS_12500 [Bradybaena similaris]
MDQQVISNFKKLYIKHLFKMCFDITENTQLTLREFWKTHFDIVVCLKIIDMAWQEVTRRTLNAAWRKLWPEVVAPRDFEDFEVEAEVNEILSLGKGLGLEVNDEDIEDLIQDHQEELSTSELKELEAMQHSAVQEGFSEKEQEAIIIPLAKIKDILGKFHEISEFIEKNHPEKVFTNRAISHFDDVCLTHFRKIVKSRQKQTSLDRFFTKRHSTATAGSEPESKKARGNDDTCSS